MGFMNAIKSLFSSSDASDAKGMRTYVVDGGRLMDEKTGRRMSPREQVQLLNALARVAKQENLDIQVVLESDKRLREVDEADQYNGIGVHFAKDSDELVDTAMRLCKKGRNGVMVSSAPNLESKAMQAGFTVLCSATFRKAFLAGGIGGGNGGRGDRDRRGGNGGGGGTALPESYSYYWSSTEFEGDIAYVELDCGSAYWYNNGDEDEDRLVRACLAF